MRAEVVSARAGLAGIAFGEAHGRVAGISGLAVSVEGLGGHVAIGDRLELRGRGSSAVAAEIVGFDVQDPEMPPVAQAMVFASLDGIGPGADARLDLWLDTDRNGQGFRDRRPGLAVDSSWLGRVIDPLGRPIDGLGPLAEGACLRPARASPPSATDRARLGPRIDLGVRALDLFTTCRAGQRLGLFAGSGVGKSTLLSMLARQADCDVAVIALVGERGREVREFLEDDLGPEGVARSVTVIATSDSPPLMRREAAYAAMTVAEHFRDQGLTVLLLMDSVTRFCLALREIALSVGEMPATRGYPPSVFAELPRLLERAGPGPVGPSGQAGQITALFTVLVEGDDHNEPVADAVRGILDGHVVMDRRLGEAGRYPAIDVLRSLSRSVPRCNDASENALTAHARRVMTHSEMSDMIRLGAYKAGSDPAVDEAIALMPRLEAVLRQGRDERTSRNDAFEQLRVALEPTPLTSERSTP